ncbi:tRNA (N(6)-L-threonylcarbamoyladenosine(37)-C(2))-methylthiotransferase MtaB [Clostridium cochlearium]|uniref:tRNA (N(6)-L-threonylcarbamoyladenosine(37)-C(2))- methylthiotransferase MtaB n=1 Tax=Clostridium cochlearium TaxID=1494 RepID=UPI001459D8CC|nr:tRNA (N(6)-L-threonylcarbamoyladenosine(37)-C(2))-methylthiotransferase MtaB [Clostridium cochlearium]MCG4571714.1 tRNA (N(6)-L-threonylcarbamoyladenosine(37)-C(2))-methylthiotransferase MtaB [Clostridium cochlearium]MCG4578637.1 tRNA (N(6)-L-threonylcarbamoyladenosine(37)-C(2))-methylthiotransferase MtaB [Clostridium cochlearium]MCR1971584.1 tRNA (N(6)-L-threonylcarbamoyladenosine(37)-C(2))-methylthiotransferase MtaB [Clostridium cochlearium]NME94677.1 tRNA (N(6)-L-threonylcarbamoyladenosin
MKVAFETLGCRVNQYETEAMIEKFIKSGYDIVHFNELADVYVINTCTVTNMGDKKSRQMISRARRINKDAIIAVVGCYSQVAPDKVSKIPGVDVVIGTRNKGDIVKKVEEYMKKKEQIILVKDVLKNNVFEELNIESYKDKTRAFLKIQDGCNNFCSYCLIPFARGGVCSKEPKKVIKEIKKLVEHGFKEVTLSGIQIALYGNDLEDSWDLISLLEEIDKIEGIERVRIGSISPKYFTDQVIERFSKLKKLCPHFHLSLQSGCDETLKRMNRSYTTKEYKHIVEKLREKIKYVSITTDIIVGFPGESEEEFKNTYKFLEEIKLSKMHVFKYSPRTGTKAAKMKEQVDGNIKEERSNILIELNKKLEKNFMEKFLGKEFQVLYEEKSNLYEDAYEGYTQNYIKVVTKSDMNLQGKIVNTIIKSVKEDYVLGKLK